LPASNLPIGEIYPLSASGLLTKGKMTNALFGKIQRPPSIDRDHAGFTAEESVSALKI
jgi:hypothetical protein